MTEQNHKIEKIFDEWKVAIIIASIGRRNEIEQLLPHLFSQTLPPWKVILSVEKNDDIPDGIPSAVEIIKGPRGLTAQRNRGLESVINNCDVIVFYDDDFIPARNSIAEIVKIFEKYPEIVASTGLVLADGVKKGGIEYDVSVDIVNNQSISNPPENIRDIDSLYGCNMALRAKAVGAIRFDETLPLYGWQEDVDFAGQLLVKGRIVSADTFQGVHRGVNKGRTPGAKLGYAQVVNPLYLFKKGTMRWKKALILVLKNIIANHMRLIWEEPFIDRRGRAKGNWIGLWHILTGSSDPRRINQIK
ncbi:glycosyltransferase [Acidiphilium sp.]|nr:glycosyltransferase [Acidiphilium sp.]